LKKKEYILATLHRDFNTDNKTRLKNIITALNEISEKIKVVLPIHPRTRKAISFHGFNNLIKNIKIIDAVPYSEMMALLIGSKKVITDSGGLQKEAYFAGVPAIVMMPDTGWIELVEAGWNVLVDADKEFIIEKAFKHNLSDNISSDIYGNGSAGEKIVDILTKDTV
jgi:UDP-N-acetylglucosamine 2-epimerase (non-hydrolysing)